MIEERVFLAAPPEAAEWARQAGLPIPPEAYDVISPPQPSPNVRIVQPEMLAYVRDQVQILGTASGPDFAYYRVQVGKGLNPKTWLQVGEDNTTPIQNGQLAMWDTGDLSGLFTLQLLAVRTDKRIEKAFVQVTVDNHPPQIQVTSPTYGQEINLAQTRIVTLRASVNDDLGIRSVAFFIDGQLLATLNQAPFFCSWTATTGDHIFRATATDLAGNTSQAEIIFQVR